MFHWLLGWYCSKCAALLVTGTSDGKQNKTSRLSGWRRMYVVLFRRVSCTTTCVSTQALGTCVQAAGLCLVRARLPEQPNLHRKSAFWRVSISERNFQNYVVTVIPVVMLWTYDCEVMNLWIWSNQIHVLLKIGSISSWFAPYISLYWGFGFYIWRLAQKGRGVLKNPSNLRTKV